METTPGPHWRLVLGRVPRAQPDPRGSRRWGELAGLVHALGDVTPRQVDGGAAVLRSRDLGRGSTPANCARYRRGRTVPDIDAGWPRHRTSPALGSGQSSSRCSRAPWRSCPLGDVTPPGGRRRRCAAVARLGTWIDARQLRPISTRPNCARYRRGGTPTPDLTGAWFWAEFLAPQSDPPRIASPDRAPRRSFTRSETSRRQADGGSRRAAVARLGSTPAPELCPISTRGDAAPDLTGGWFRAEFLAAARTAAIGGALDSGHSSSPGRAVAFVTLHLESGHSSATRGPGAGGWRRARDRACVHSRGRRAPLRYRTLPHATHSSASAR